MSQPLLNRGDTIVEVLIAIAVASLVLASAYVLSGHSLKSTRQAQEHTEALKLAESQLELLRSAASDATVPTVFNYPSYFCMLNGTSAGITTATTALPPAGIIDATGANFTFPTPNSSTDTFTYTPVATGCTVSNGGLAYHQAIDRKGKTPPGDYTFQVHIRWDSIQGNGHDDVSLMYRLNQ